MIAVRWWVAAVTIPLLLGMGVVVGYLIERTIHSLPVPSQPIPAGPPVAGRTPNPTLERDPAMVAGAAFMARVTGYKQRLEQNPEDLEALIFLGNANYDITRFEKATEYYKQALAIDPTNIHVRTDLATSYYSIGQVDNALAQIQTVLEQAPIHETALFNLGVILLEAKQDKKGAIEAWGKLLREHPNTARAQTIQEKIEQLKAQS